ncbi:MAG: hypothetical protein E6K63_03785 [Nitrospirae bacterium]|nr:MAG: hypothetical protein E6K63_03785 [Nitrospirota bacterium]
MTDEQAVHQAITTISQSDPLIKLLQQVKLGQMRASDPGLRAITEAWLGTYQKVLDTTALTRQALVRLDPSPRLDVLIEAGVLNPDHQGVSSLRAGFEKALAQAASV